MTLLSRCPWAVEPFLIEYHDREWGVPLHDDQKLFELLALEGMQAGLSWLTILRKRDNFRKAFDNFVPRIVARYDAKKMDDLMRDEGIVRNRRKIESIVQNARVCLSIQEESGSFDRYIWQFVGYKPKLNAIKGMQDYQPRTAESDAMSKELKRRGMNFVGSTICYAFMQAAGLVNDHVVSCFRYHEAGCAQKAAP